MSSLKRSLPIAPEYNIDRDGNVSVDTVRLPTLTISGANGLRTLGVEIKDNRIEVWKLMALVWYDRKPIFTRCGSLMNMSRGNLFTVGTWAFKHRISDQSHQHAAWYEYQSRGCPISGLRDATGLTIYDDSDFQGLIQSLVLAGVRR